MKHPKLTVIMRGIVILLCGFALGAQDTGSPAGLMADCEFLNTDYICFCGKMSLYEEV